MCTIAHKHARAFCKPLSLVRYDTSVEVCQLLAFFPGTFVLVICLFVLNFFESLITASLGEMFALWQANKCIFVALMLVE